MPKTMMLGFYSQVILKKKKKKKKKLKEKLKKLRPRLAQKKCPSFA